MEDKESGILYTQYQTEWKHVATSSKQRSQNILIAALEALSSWCQVALLLTWFNFNPSMDK